ncbi:MAG: ATP-binding cassette domain-containing protein [Clostridia bacterium]|nr:ATP-binding cassette domain-containing protein [Clostridia bacterium]
MIKVTNLTKIYKSKGSFDCKALDDVSFVLDDKGFVFVIGKSGSGKSTLLNMLGALDNVTSGDVIVDGNSLSSLKNSQFDDYRNNNIGFIFQDFHLIDSLTVRRNVELSLDLQNRTDKGEVDDALKKVGLNGYADRYPRELSGGQKQRVAIARAIVKNPKVVLADEPTGNLDTKTSKQIISLLKELSKEILIVVVSHNLADAHNNADRIIELADGKILSDTSEISSYKDEVSICNDTVTLPYMRKLTADEKVLIEKALFNGEIKHIKQLDGKFKKTVEPQYNEKQVPLQKTKLKPAKAVKLTGNMIKSSVWRSFVSAFVVACIIVVLALSQTIIAFDSAQVINNEFAKASEGQPIILQKNDYYGTNTSKINSSYTIPISQKDLNALKNVAGEGNAFQLINHTLPITTTVRQDGVQYGRKYIANNFFAAETLGTLITDEQFLIDKFGKDGKLPLICGDIDDKSYGVVVTDYFADSYFIRKKIIDRDYTKLLGEYVYSTSNVHGYINAIIDTDYETKYKEIVDVFLSGEQIDVINEFSNNQLYMQANDEIMQYLAIGYTINPNFINDFDESEIRYFAKPGLFVYNDDTSTARANMHFRKQEEKHLVDKDKNPIVLTGNEIAMNYSQFNQLFGTEWTYQNCHEYVANSQTIKISTYNPCDTKFKTPVFEKTFKIKAILRSSGSGSGYYCSDEVFDYLVENHSFYTWQLYFDGYEDANALYAKAGEMGYLPTAIMVEGISTMAYAVESFAELFELISFVLYAACILVLVNFSSKLVKQRKYDIGVLRALGCKNSSLAFVFITQILLVGIATCIMAYLGMFVFIDLANSVLVESLKRLASSFLVFDMQFLTFKNSIILPDCIAVLAITVVSTIIPLVMLRKIKPVNIIKSKE